VIQQIHGWIITVSVGIGSLGIDPGKLLRNNKSAITIGIEKPSVNRNGVNSLFGLFGATISTSQELKWGRTY
jgi:hypothetical protein